MLYVMLCTSVMYMFYSCEHLFTDAAGHLIIYITTSVRSMQEVDWHEEKAALLKSIRDKQERLKDYEKVSTRRACLVNDC